MENITFRNRKDAINELASRFVKYISDFPLSRNINILVSGGNTPRILYNELLSKFDVSIWSNCRFIMVDERFVPFSSDRSNSGSCHRVFANKVELADFIYPDTSIELEKSLRFYSKKVEALIADEGFDLALLGTASDGHVASIFSKSTPLYSSGVAFACGLSEPYEKRISLNLESINSSQRIWVMALGGEKQYKLLKAKHNQEGDLPVFKLCSKKTTWFSSD